MSDRAKTVAPDSGDRQSAAFQHQSLLPWPERTFADPVNPEQDLNHKTRPTELDLLPDGVDTPFELLQIFKAAWRKDALKFWTDGDQRLRERIPQVDAPQTELESVSSVYSNLGSGDDETCTPSTASSSSHETTQNETGEQKSTTSSSTRPKSRLLSSTAEFLSSKLKHKRSRTVRASSLTSISPVKAQCASCFEDLPVDDVRRLECTHAYCAPCLKTLVQTAAQTESLFPPRCCLIEIPLKTVLYALSPDQRNAYKSKAAEYAQPAGERWYCPDPDCAKWIPPSALVHSILSSQKCSHCKIKICSMCRGQAHDRGTNCPQDFGLNAVLDEAEREGWRRCYACHSLVEKTTGCRHMTCTCKAQFCYTCGAKWRTCGCTEVDQARREEELRARRHFSNAEVQQEQDEIARAIAEVEILEVMEAEERRQAEMRREEEQRREEEELRRLEQERLVEDESRRREAEEAERMRVETIKSSIEERAFFLGQKMDEITLLQQMAVLARHESAEQAILNTKENQQSKRMTSFNAMKQKMLTNIEKRSRHLSMSHSGEVMVVASRHEQEDDEMFLKVQLHLRGRPNREAREKVMLDALAQAHNDEVDNLQRKHESSLSVLRKNAAVEIRGLEHGLREDQETANRFFEVEMRALGKTVGSDHLLFEEITRRRQELLEQLRLNQLRSMGESRLLETWEAIFAAEEGSRAEEEVTTQDPVDRSVGLEVVPTAQESSPALEPLQVEVLDQDTAKELTPAGPRTPPPQLTINTASLESSQAVWDAESLHSHHSSTSRLSLTLRTKQKTGRPEKPSRFSLHRHSGKPEMDKETFDRLLRQSVGDAR